MCPVRSVTYVSGRSYLQRQEEIDKKTFLKKTVSLLQELLAEKQKQAQVTVCACVAMAKRSPSVFRLSQ